MVIVMDALMIILIFIILVICIIVGLYTVMFNKIQDYIIRINEVEASIDNLLRNKYDTINKCVSIIKGNEKIIMVDGCGVKGWFDIPFI